MYTPPFTISAAAINKIADISRLIERYAIRMEQEDALLLRKANKIKTIHSSLAIEGNTLNEDQVRDIVNGKTVVAPLREIQEVKNAIATYEQFPHLNPFKEKDLLRAHGIMMQALVDNAGHYSPIIVDENGEVLENLNCKKGIPIGVLPDCDYHSNTFDVKNFPMIFMFTDGALEIKNKNKEEYGLDRLKAFVKGNYKNSRNKILENLKKETENFTGSDNYDDDILILMLKNI